MLGICMTLHHLYLLVSINLSSSSFVGSPSLSLMFITWIAPMAFPRLTLSLIVLPSRIPLMTPTANPSPAPTVSTTLSTWNPGTV